MSLTAGVCRYCGCTEENPCSVPPYCDGDTCGWIGGTGRTVCTAPPCIMRWAEDSKAVKRASKKKRLTSADINDLICGRRRKKKKGRAA